MSVAPKGSELTAEDLESDDVNVALTGFPKLAAGPQLAAAFTKLGEGVGPPSGTALKGAAMPEVAKTLYKSIAISRRR